MNVFKCKEGLRLRASTAGSMGLIPRQGTKIPCVTLCSQEKKKKKNSNAKSWNELFCEYPHAHHPDPTTIDFPFSPPTCPPYPPLFLMHFKVSCTHPYISPLYTLARILL